MDIEENQEKESGKPEKLPGQKKFSPKFIILLLVLLLILSGGGFFGWTYIKRSNAEGNKPDSKSGSIEKSAESVLEETDVLNLNPFIVNLADSSGNRYLKVKMQLEIEKSLLDEVNSNTLLLPRIRDKILMILTTKTFDEVLNMKGKILLRKEIIIRLNEFLKKGSVKNVYFTEFVVQ